MRGLAVLLAALGLAISAPVQRIDRSSDARAGITPPGDRGDAPAIRTSSDLGRNIAQPVPLALPPAVVQLRAPDIAGIVRSRGEAGGAGRRRPGAHRARAPPLPV